jgi:multiple antibiotic resistance protein
MIALLYVGEELLKLIGIEVSSFEVTEPFIFLALKMILAIRTYCD